jgi:putative ATP-dependent endonuclease of OLD family
VNVGGIGLRRFAHIFQRKVLDKDGTINVPVACVTDLDVMPDCAPGIVGKVKKGEPWPEKRRWRAKSDFEGEALAARREEIRAKAGGQNVETFVSDEWTLEYDLAHAGLAEDVWIAAHLALADEQINAQKTKRNTVETDAATAFATLNTNGTSQEELASHVYALFTTGSQASKAITAQYLAERLEKRVKDGTLTAQRLRENLPPYLVAAIEHVTPHTPHGAPVETGADAGTVAGAPSGGDPP